MLIVGSRALKQWKVPLSRKVGDIDIIATRDECVRFLSDQKENIESHYLKNDKKHVVYMKKGPIHEFELALPDSSGEDILREETNYNVSLGRPTYIMYARPSTCYMLKMSHRYLKDSPHFRKTMDDILDMRGLHIDIFTDEMRKILKKREK